MELTQEEKQRYENAAKEIGAFQYHHLEHHGKLERELKSQIEFLAQENIKQAELIKDLYRITREQENWLRLCDNSIKALRQEKADKNKMINATATTNGKPIEIKLNNWKFWK